MVVGAHGGLGASVVKWLVNQGAQELVMVGRRPHADSPAVKFLTSFGERRLKIHNLIFPENVDFDVSTLQLDTVERPLGGVLHLAGTLSDQNIETMAWSEFFSPFPAKVDVAVNLVKYISRMPEVPLVMFSSLASLIGSPGQSNYAAANAFLDGLAASGKSNVFSINWGPWDGPGMADRIPPNLRATLMDGGVGFLAPEAALAVLGDIELDSGGHCVVATVDWARWPDKGGVFDRLVQGSPDTTIGGALRTQLQQRPKAQRRGLLLKKLTEMVAGALHLDRESISPRARLFDLGIDSLTAMQLRSALQLDLSTKLESTLLFDYPTLEKLAVHILDHYVNEDVAKASQKKKEDSNLGEKIDTSKLTAALEQLKASLN
jgi:myxalamid-type polyketide synthase MxaB